MGYCYNLLKQMLAKDSSTGSVSKNPSQNISYTWRKALYIELITEIIERKKGFILWFRAGLGCEMPR